MAIKTFKILFSPKGVEELILKGENGICYVEISVQDQVILGSDDDLVHSPKLIFIKTKMANTVEVPDEARLLVGCPTPPCVPRDIAILKDLQQLSVLFADTTKYFDNK